MAKTRLANVELLRTVAMIMVIIMHFVRESGYLLTAQTESLSFQYVLAMLLESFCIVAVNAFVFISGYYGTEGSYKTSKVLRFWFRVLFYTLLIPVVLICFGIPTVWNLEGIYGLVQYVLPISSEHYWFASAYFYLLLLMPFLNKGINSLSRQQLAVITVGLLMVFCVVKSVVPVKLAFDRFGYDVIWFVCVYLVAAYLRLYGGKYQEWLKKYGLMLYVASSILIFGLTLGIWKVLPNFSGLSYYFEVLFHYNFILCLTGAIGLFYAFSRMNIREGKIAEICRNLGKYCFGIYLLHEHIDLRHFWYPLLTGNMGVAVSDNIGGFVLALLVCVVILFMAGICIDWIREKIFVVICKMAGKTFVGEAVCKLDDICVKKEG